MGADFVSIVVDGGLPVVRAAPPVARARVALAVEVPGPALVVPGRPRLLPQRRPHGLRVVEVALGLREHEHVLVGAVGAIEHVLGHRVRLVPDDVPTQPPARVAKGEGHLPRDPDEVFRLQARARLRAGDARADDRRHAVGDFALQPLAAALTTGVAVAEVQPQHAVGGEHALHLLEDLDEARDELSRRRLLAELLRVPIVAEPPVGRARDARLHGSALELPQLVECLAVEDGPGHRPDPGAARHLDRQ